MINYGFTKKLDKSFEQVCTELPGYLKQEGFGILTKIDVQKKFREKLDLDFKQYKIFGACHPGHAYQALTVEENIGLMLPCNVAVFADNSGTNVALIRPTVAMGMIDNPELAEIARIVEQKIKHVFELIE